jgi:hypothetical protein
MLPLQKRTLNGNLDRRLASAENPPCSLKRSQSDKTAQTAGFTLRGLFQQLALFLRVVREHLFPQRLSGSAP